MSLPFHIARHLTDAVQSAAQTAAQQSSFDPEVRAVDPLANSALAYAEPPARDRLTLTIFHTNDIHGHLLPFDDAKVGAMSAQASVGGAARRATILRRLRAELTNPSITLDSGDLVHPGPLAFTYEGIPDVETFNALGYDLAVIGNTDLRLKDGRDRLDSTGARASFQRLVRAARFTWLSANVLDSRGALLDGVQPFAVRDFDGVRVAFLGLTTPGATNVTQTKGMVALDAIAAAKDWIPRARAESDVLVLVSHLGFSLETKLVAATTGIDAVVGGHSHTLLNEAALVKNAEGVPIPVVQTGEFGVRLGRFTLRFERAPVPRGWHLARFDYELFPIDADIPEAEDVNALLDPYVRPLKTEIVARLPSLPSDPSEASRFTQQTVADALLTAAQTDLAIVAFGKGILDRFRHREVTRYDLNAVLALPHNIVTTSLTGAQLTALEKNNPALLIVGQANLSPERTYTVALFDTVAVNAYKLPESSLRDTGIDAREALLRHLNRSLAPSHKAAMPAQSPPTRAVLIDLDDTILDHQHARRTALLAMQSAYEPLALRELRELERIHERHLDSTFARRAARELTLEASRRERMRLLLAEHAVALSPEECDDAEALYRRAYDDARRPVPGVVALIAVLRARGLKLAVVTNGFAAEQHEKLCLCGLADAFDAIVLGGDLGLRKPDPAIFHNALTALQLPPESSVVLGDSWEFDVIGARNAGLRAVWLNRYGEPYPEIDNDQREHVPSVTALEPLDNVLHLLLP